MIIRSSSERFASEEQSVCLFRHRAHAVWSSGLAAAEDQLDAAKKLGLIPSFFPIHDTPNPEGGVIQREADGVTPNGVLEENAMAAMLAAFWGDRHKALFLGPERAARIDPAKSAHDRGMRLITLHL